MHDKAQALATDLERAGVKVLDVRQSTHYLHMGEWQVIARCEEPFHEYSVTDAQLFRASVRRGLILDIAPDALNHNP